ncbi:hypothetical protein G4B88_009753 [Cannabis sativa]|uniref:Small ribosomal subunit protein uS2c n=1 Tax=Cannabis sativa TaxID=3483 RepID=A0A7J6DN96_CANSA|nr:hypothetical protein G4B88_009753 [Cannabis sativa]
MECLMFFYPENLLDCCTRNERGVLLKKQFNNKSISKYLKFHIRSEFSRNCSRFSKSRVIQSEEMWGEMTRRYWNINLEEMMEAKVHFGHGTKKWNPRMAPYISTKRKGIHIINLTRTAQFLSSVM